MALEAFVITPSPCIGRDPMTLWALLHPAATKRLHGSWRSDQQPSLLQQRNFSTTRKPLIEKVTSNYEGKKHGQSRLSFFLHLDLDPFSSRLHGLPSSMEAHSSTHVPDRVRTPLHD